MKKPIPYKKALPVLLEARGFLSKLGIEIDVRAIRAACREAQLIRQRQYVSYYLRKKGLESVLIGGYLNRDHSSVLNLLKKIRKKALKDGVIRQRLNSITFAVAGKSIRERIRCHQAEINELRESLVKP